MKTHTDRWADGQTDTRRFPKACTSLRHRACKRTPVSPSFLVDTQVPRPGVNLLGPNPGSFEDAFFGSAQDRSEQRCRDRGCSDRSWAPPKKPGLGPKWLTPGLVHLHDGICAAATWKLCACYSCSIHVDMICNASMHRCDMKAMCKLRLSATALRSGVLWGWKEISPLS